MSFNNSWTGTGTNAGDVMVTIEDALSYGIFAILSTVGVVTVEGSIDGTNYGATALAMQDETAAAPATRVVVTTAGKMASLKNAGYKAIRIKQSGATGATVYVGARGPS